MYRYIYMTNSDYEIIFHMIQKGFCYLGLLLLHICILPQYTPFPIKKSQRAFPWGKKRHLAGAGFRAAF